MYGRLPRTLGFWLIIFLGVLGFFALELLFNTFLLWHGVTVQGVITDERSTICKTFGSEKIFSVWFYDQAGRSYHGTISQCDYIGFNASPGDWVTLVYLPESPTTIAPPDELITNVQGQLVVTPFCGFITLVLLLLWIRKRIRRGSLQHEHAQAGYSAEQDQSEPTNFSTYT